MLSVAFALSPVALVLPSLSAPAAVHSAAAATLHSAAVGQHTTSLLAMVDPFADPIYGAASEVATAAPANGMHTVLVGLSVYAISMAALTYWDAKVLPKLQDKGILPRIKTNPYEPDEMTAEERGLPWLTPLTADRTVPLPAYSELEKGCHHIGSSGDIHQYICPAEDHKPDPYTQCQVSTEFSDMYGKPVLVCKRKVQ